MLFLPVAMSSDLRLGRLWSTIGEPLASGAPPKLQLTHNSLGGEGQTPLIHPHD